jgi:hypothetical protein
VVVVGVHFCLVGFVTNLFVAELYLLSRVMAFWLWWRFADVWVDWARASFVDLVDDLFFY